MTSSSGSTIPNKSGRLPAVSLALLLCGCASQTAAPKAPHISGYVDLAALIRTRPGWSGLAQYDAALARLSAAAALPPAGRADPKLAVLPALPVQAADQSVTENAAGIAGRLSQTQAALTGSLDDRRRAARAEQIRRQQELWTREARRLFPVPARTVELSSDLTLQLLQANVAALTQTLDHWDNSVPPAPKLDALRKKVEADRSRLQALIATRVRTREAARAARLEAIQSMRQARLDYVSAQGAALSAKLEAADARVVSDQNRRLTAQRLQLLGALARPAPSEVPVSGNAGTLSLPRGPETAPASLPGNSLAAARATLLAQRGRWSQYLADDTRAAALDAAAAHGWTITFGPPQRGGRDLTAEMERALAKD